MSKFAIKQGYIVKSVLFISFLLFISLGAIAGFSDGRGQNYSQGLIERYSVGAANILKAVQNAVIKDAQAQQSVAENINTLLSTNSCTSCLLRGADLSGAILRDADLFRSNLHWTNLSRVNLIGANLREVEFNHSTSVGAELSGAELRNADFRGAANFTDADFRGAELRNANMFRAILRGADFRGANLRNANLSNASLNGANFRSANLRDADLRGAILEGADFSNADWCTGRCVCAEGSFGRCNGCQSVDFCTGP